MRDYCELVRVSYFFAFLFYFWFFGCGLRRSSKFIHSLDCILTSLQMKRASLFAIWIGTFGVVRCKIIQFEVDEIFGELRWDNSNPGFIHKFIRSTARSTVDTMFHIFEKHLIATCQSVPFARKCSVKCSAIQRCHLRPQFKSNFQVKLAANLKSRQFLIGFVFSICFNGKIEENGNFIRLISYFWFLSSVRSSFISILCKHKCIHFVFIPFFIHFCHVLTHKV